MAAEEHKGKQRKSAEIPRRAKKLNPAGRSKKEEFRRYDENWKAAELWEPLGKQGSAILNPNTKKAYKQYDPNSYASIPGWGGNDKYYHKLVQMGMQKELGDIKSRVFDPEVNPTYSYSAKHSQSGFNKSKGFNFAGVAANNVLN